MIEQRESDRVRRGAFGTNVFATSMVQVGLLLLSLPTSVITARALGPAGRGEYALVILLGTFVAYFTGLGVAQGAMYFLARKEYPPATILGNSVLFAIVLSLVGMGLGAAVLLGFREQLAPNLQPSMILIGLAVVPVQVVATLLLQLLLGLHRVMRYNFMSLLRSLASLVGVVALLLILNRGVWAAVLVEVVAFAVTAVVVYGSLRRMIGGATFRIDTGFLKNVLRYGLSVHIGRIALLLVYRADLYLISLFMNPASVGLFSVSRSLVEKMSLIWGGAATLLVPKVASQSEQSRRELTPLVLKTILLLSAVAAVGLAIVGPLLIRLLFSERYAGSIPPLVALLPGAVALAGWSILDSDFKGRGKPLWSTYSVLAALVVNIALNLWWIPLYGISGAAWASSVSYIVILAFALILYVRASDLSWTAAMLPQRSDLDLYREVARGLVTRYRER